MICKSLALPLPQKREIFARIVRSRIEWLGISATALAAKCGFSRDVMNDLLNGNSYPHAKTVGAICKVLEIREEDLVEEDLVEDEGLFERLERLRNTLVARPSPRKSVFLEVVRAKMKERGLSGRALALKCGLSSGVISCFLRGVHWPLPSTLDKLCKVLEIDDEILN
jgi:transcriptional regulator with XRE-family HTH domain